MARRIIIVGAGQAGRRCAEALRELDAAAEIMIFGAEAHLPYDRPPLSKSVLLGRDPGPALFVRRAEYYAEQHITLHLGEVVTRLHTQNKRIETAQGRSFAYDVLVLATGAKARGLAVTGADDARVMTLRSLDDARALQAQLAEKPKLAVIGGGLIGLEVAASARLLGCAVDVLEAGERLMARGVPASISRRMAALHQEHGVALHFNAGLERIEGADREVILHLKNGRRLAVDLVLVGIGATPETSLAAEAGLAVADGILTDHAGRTSLPDIYAAGEVARFPNPLRPEASMRQETWQVAQQQPVAVAHAIMGQEKPYEEIPWHWTDQFDCNLQVLGEPNEQPHQIERAEGERLTLLACDSDGRLRGAILINNGREATLCRRLIASGKGLDRAALSDIAQPLRGFL
ncbi:MAG: FAD-dependent oxidoreductase [Roseomonas sp.]|nr:FAD-dependent oxidoreductase [Roseomonas sp.]MCA3334388.1 FAD-dependent oxidoreductase [Roseomonas sp.]MCA3386436.1 FAD-dependent oxidoreductase [Roseomonas sp.]MCA3398048.1 FAD-dependent oxidoreductase [Roseomonas sp.]MCA3401530.1 FAD-dependent oxidoreductase [Roseomonas sp.]